MTDSAQLKYFNILGSENTKIFIKYRLINIFGVIILKIKKINNKESLNLKQNKIQISQKIMVQITIM